MTRPVMGDATPSLETLPDIVGRQKAITRVFHQIGPYPGTFGVRTLYRYLGERLERKDHKFAERVAGDLVADYMAFRVIELFKAVTEPNIAEAAAEAIKP